MNTILTKIIFSLSILLMQANIYAQLLTEIPTIGEFKPEIEQVETPLHGIQLYDQYCVMNKEPKIRTMPGGTIANGAQEDSYENGKTLHKGTYKEGKLESFTNFFVNGQIERKYKFKATGKGDLIVYYGSGNKRLIQKYYNYTPIEIEVFNEDEILIKTEKYDKNSLEPIEIKSFHNNGKLKSLTESKSANDKTYSYTAYSDVGKIVKQGELTYNNDAAEIQKSGNWLTFNEDNQIIIDVEYNAGLVTKINEGEALVKVDDSYTMDSDSTPVVTYIDNSTTDVTASTENTTDEGNSTTKSAIDTGSTLDTKIARFDKDGNNEITVMELHGAINDFFDDESIELSQIDFLINFFFDQD